MTGKDTQDTKDTPTPTNEPPTAASQPKAQRKGPTIKDQNGNEIPFTPAPRSHASESLSRLAARGAAQARERANPGFPDAATPEAKANAHYVPLPAGGLAALADSTYDGPDDDQDAKDNHLFNLMLLNNDLVRDDTSSTVGQMVRVPA